MTQSKMRKIVIVVSLPAPDSSAYCFSAMTNPSLRTIQSAAKGCCGKLGFLARFYDADRGDLFLNENDHDVDQLACSRIPDGGLG